MATPESWGRRPVTNTVLSVLCGVLFCLPVAALSIISVVALAGPACRATRPHTQSMKTADTASKFDWPQPDNNALPDSDFDNPAMAISTSTNQRVPIAAAGGTVDGIIGPHGEWRRPPVVHGI